MLKTNRSRRKKETVCKVCAGNGFSRGVYGDTKCSACLGTGKVEEPTIKGTNFVKQSEEYKWVNKPASTELPTIKGKETAEERILREFNQRFPMRASIEYPDKDVFYSRERFGLMEATPEDIKSFLLKSLKDYKRELLEDAVRVIDKYTSPAHPHVHSMRQLRLDSPRLKKMVDELKALADLSAE